MIEGYLAPFHLEHGSGRPAVSWSRRGQVASAWRGRWGLTGLDDDAHASSVAAGGSWLAWSGRAWWRDSGEQTGPVTARRLLDTLLDTGAKALERIDGSFAIAWFDATEGSLWLARDYFGIEPLHYAMLDDRAVFASRLPSLPPWLNGGARISTSGLRDYFVYGFCPADQTLVDGVLRVPQGGAVGLQLRDGRVFSTKQLWHRLSFRQQPLIDDDVIAETFGTELEVSVRRRLGSGRAAVMLSGGMDSSAIASLMRRHDPGEIRAFTFRCSGKSFDESVFARRVAADLGMKHTQIELSEKEAMAFSEGVAAMDCPFSDAGIEIGTWLVAKAAEGEADYILVGDGGDELWGSHPIYAAQRIVRLYDAAPIGRLPRRWLRRLLNAVPDSPRKRDLFVVAKRLLPDPDLPTALKHLRWKIYHDARSLRSLLDGVQLPEESAEAFFASALQAFEGFDGGSGNPDAMLYNDYRTATAFYVSRLLLFRRFGIEPRLPFLDAGLTELGTRIPFDKKLEGLHRTKRLFRRAMEGTMPESVLNRTDKLGHSVPMKNWLRSRGPLAREVTGVLLEEMAARRGLVRRRAVEQMLTEHTASRHNHSHRLWGLYVLELWLQQHLDKASDIASERRLCVGETA